MPIVRKNCPNDLDVWQREAEGRFPKGNHILIVATPLQRGPWLSEFSPLVAFSPGSPWYQFSGREPDRELSFHLIPAITSNFFMMLLQRGGLN